MKKTKLLLLSLLGVSLFSACTNNDPIQARKDLLGPEDYGQIRATRLIAQGSDTSLGKIANVGRSIYLVAGNLATTQSRFLIRFNGFTGTVKKAQLALPIHLFMGAGTDFSPTIHRVTGNWQEDSVTADKFNNQFDPATAGTPISVALDSLRKNTDKDTLWFNIDSTLVQSWIADTTNNFGLLVNSSAPDLLVEYHSRNGITKVPRLKLLLTQSTGRDTTLSFAASADASIFTRSGILPTDRLYLGNGEQWQTYLKFTPLDSIPANATINRAELQLSIDSTNTLLNADGMTLSVYVVKSIESTGELKFILDDPNDVNDPLLVGAGVVLPADQTLKITLRTLTQSWILEPEKNFGILLESVSPTRDLSRVAFFGGHLDPERAPRMQIDYTIPPK